MATTSFSPPPTPSASIFSTPPTPSASLHLSLLLVFASLRLRLLPASASLRHPLPPIPSSTPSASIFSPIWVPTTTLCARGGISRMKQHLAGSKGNVDSCKRVPSDVQFLMQGSLKENVQKAKEKKGCFDELEGDGCTIMGDGWTDSRQRSLINFLVYSPKGVSFIKSVDALGFITNAETLCNLFSEIIEMVGPKNVVHMVTNNGANYKAAGRKITENLAILASKITVFIYNHKWVLNWLRNQPNWTEIIRPGATRFATTFIALQMVKIMGPLIRLLRICDSDEKPAMGYVYDGKYRTRKSIKELFKRKKHLYKPYTSIIKDRWNRTLRTGIHVLAYWLNPAFQFDEHNLCQKLEVQRSILDVIEQQTMFKPSELMEEMKVFRERQKTFARPLALSISKTTTPDEWWKFFGCDVPNLQKLAIRILSQTVSSSGLASKDRSYDPIDYECIDKTEFWVVEKEPEGELDYDELESMLEEQPRVDEESTNLSKGGNEDDMVGIEDDHNPMNGVQGMAINELDEENWLT
ncbi:uncharacterized protein LOC120265048 [Dioscorea cayenensis subsp. rotundata]|uniref:Uncharacterized protein LOC120265048 n=1 Tax=Dioscorea cayennensis subsp. rotundata TaxID=55577 RepID=A0AB40BQE0_DIOCR|nr:uncharacterized protein LOC120265048 [Dioscorea cayenensis subsp. rotundata]